MIEYDHNAIGFLFFFGVHLYIVRLLQNSVSVQCLPAIKVLLVIQSPYLLFSHVFVRRRTGLQFLA